MTQKGFDFRCLRNWDSALIMRCLRYRIPGALIYGPSRIGKTRAIEYLRLLLAETQPKITTYHTQAEH